jgi:predicted DNA-binding ribbon-helix-helix protein
MDMKSSILKRSIEPNGHKPSVSLEDEFWNGLRFIAETERTSREQLLRTIDGERGIANLSSAIRVSVFNYFMGAAQKRLTPSEPVHPAASYSGPALVRIAS